MTAFEAGVLVGVLICTIVNWALYLWLLLWLRR